MKDLHISYGEYGKFKIAWGTHVGRVREGNEDALLVMEGGQGAMLMAVADGLGGHAAGEVASSMAVAALSQGIQDAEHPGRDLKSILEGAHQTILDQASKNMSRRGMSTTCSALVFQQDQYWIAHVGDTRIYRVANRELHLLTQDHTWEASIQKSGNLGFIPPAAKHVLTRCLGTQNAFSVDSATASLDSLDEGFLLCSDGLYGQVSESECSDLWQNDPQTVVSKLIQAALDAGGPDNISVIAAKL